MTADHKGTILVVDDEVPVLEVMAEILEGCFKYHPFMAIEI